jgi:hypothetical protein
LPFYSFSNEKYLKAAELDLCLFATRISEQANKQSYHPVREQNEGSSCYDSEVLES